MERRAYLIYFIYVFLDYLSLFQPNNLKKIEGRRLLELAEAVRITHNQINNSGDEKFKFRKNRHRIPNKLKNHARLLSAGKWRGIPGSETWEQRTVLPQNVASGVHNNIPELNKNVKQDILSPPTINRY